MSERLAALHELCKQLAPRATRDLDVVPDHDRENLRHFVAALRDMQATLPLAGRRFDPAIDLRQLERRANMTLDTAYGGLGVVQQARGAHAFATLAAMRSRPTFSRPRTHLLAGALTGDEGGSGSRSGPRRP
jgi:hypothetical protein